MKKIGLFLIICLIVVSSLGLVAYSTNAEDNYSNRCMRCHNQAKEDWRDSTHSKQGVDCISCHKKDMKLRQSEDKICLSCHTTSQAQEEELIGMPQKEIIEGSRMDKVGVTCIDCHMPDEEDHIFELDDSSEQNEACTSCHTGFSNDTIQKQIDRWQKETENLLREVDRLLSKKNKFKDKEAYKQAEKNYLLVREDGSRGVHNPHYTRELLEAACQMLKNL